MVIAMPTHFAASIALTLTLVGLGLQSSAAQSPPKTGEAPLIWSDRDLSLHPGAFDSSPELETTPRLPQVVSPTDFPTPHQGDILVCEPGQIGSADAAVAAYAQLGKDWRIQTRR
jgi:hypothetical protein